MGPSFHSSCRCGDTGDSEEPGPHCHRHRCGKRRTSRLPRYPPGAGVQRRGGGKQAPKAGTAFTTTPPPHTKRGASAPAWCEVGKLRHMAREPSLGFVGVGRSQEGVLLSHSSCPPNPSSIPRIPPPILPHCRMWLCQAARYTLRDRYNSSHPPPHAAQCQITPPQANPPHWKT